MKTTEPKTQPVSNNTSTSPIVKSKGQYFFGGQTKPGEPFFNPSFIQPKLEVGRPNDKYEREADAVADKVMRMPDPQVQMQSGYEEEEEEEFMNVGTPPIQMKCKECEQEEKLQMKPKLQLKSNGESVAGSALTEQLQLSKRSGSPLPSRTQDELGSKMGADFSGVNVHTDSKAAQMNQQLGARAFTHGNDIYFNSGEYDPVSNSGKHLLAHELTHVVQQADIRDTLQRVVELRPPGPGEASAFNRVGALIDRINEQSDRVLYFLRGNRLEYEVIPADQIILNPFAVRSPNFDRQMMGFIDAAQVVPLRLITGTGYVRNRAGTFGPLLHDSWTLAYVDLDDLLASDDPGFQSQLVHILAERFATHDYERRIGSPSFTMAEFNRVHRAAYAAEARLFRSMIGDPTINYLYSELRPNGTWVVAFQSNEGYRIFKVFRGMGQDVRGAEVWVRTRDGRRLSIIDLIAEREAARNEGL